ncbi:MAG: Eco57I restriction-modification methylase domain-containing protein [Candidatus Binatia bacterium]
MVVQDPPKEIITLSDRFEVNADSYRNPSYGEAELRVEFINPLFEALGWDVTNKAGHAEAYKDVIHEDAIKIGGATKAPDYSFRIGGTRKFFLEAKKPAVNIKDEPSPAYQLRRYAWSARLPLSILTNFAEFSVYDCRLPPKETDKASIGRILYLTFKEYPGRWEEIAKIFSKDAVLKGSFDKFAEAGKGKKGTSQVDEEFLTEIESWRDALAKNLALRNPKLSVRDLNFAVQRTIDRIIFLRMCEDRGVEQYEQLQALLNGENVYKRLHRLYRLADEKYNSGLFHFEEEKGRAEVPDKLTLGLKIDDKVLKDIIRRLYYPESPYEFSVLGADILGNVYEQFLGKVIRLTPGHHAVVEEKPEVKKAGGVYYTPAYIVDYIVKNTVGKLCEGKNPKQLSGVRVLDPACGSGSFLIGAYTYLLNYHRDWYVNDGPQKHTKEIYQGTGGQWLLTTQEKKRILLNNIYGVDIDSQAVEVTKLSLLLRVLEGESEETIGKSLKLFRERALPDLGNNIKCGNSLIGPDFYQNQQMSLLDEEERYRINVFDWNAEFPEIMKSSGFHTVIGNPPYIRVRFFKDFYPEQVNYLESKYRCATHVWDIYLLFFERAIELTRKDGRVGFIVPIQTLHQPNCESLRKLLLEETSISSVADLSRLRIFQGAIIKNCILVCKKSRHPDARIDLFAPNLPEQLSEKPKGIWPQKALSNNPGFSFKLDLMSSKSHLCEKIEARSWRLDELCYVTFGLRSSAKGVGQGGKDRLITSSGKTRDARPYLEGRDIKRYATYPTGRFIRYIPSEMYSPRSPLLFETKKIISQSMLSKMQLVATLDEASYYVEQSLVCIIPHGILTQVTPPEAVPLEFILGIINSRLESFYFATRIIDYSLGGGLIHATPGSQTKLLVPRVPKPRIDKMILLVEQMLELHKQLQSAKNPNDKTRLQREIEATDHQIDQLVYELYDLTEEEIRIVTDSAT